MPPSGAIRAELELIEDNKVRVTINDSEKVELYKSYRSFKTDIDDKELYIEINKHVISLIKQGDKPSVTSKVNIKNILELTSQQAKRTVQLTPIEKKSRGASLNGKESPSGKMSGRSSSGNVSLESFSPSSVSLRSGTPIKTENKQQENTEQNTQEVEGLQQQLKDKDEKMAQLSAKVDQLRQENTALKDSQNPDETLKTQLEATKKEELDSKEAELQTKLTEAEEAKTKLETEKNELNTEVQQLEKEKEELKAQKKEAEQERASLQIQLDSLTGGHQKVGTAVDSLFTDELNKKIKGLTESTDQSLADKVKTFYDENLKNKIIDNNLLEVQNKEQLHTQLQDKIKSIIETGQSKDVGEIVKSIKEELKDNILNTGKFSKEIADLQQQLQVKADEIAKLKQQQPNPDVEKLKADLKEAQKAKVKQLESEKAALETKNKAIVQPKQGNRARYTAIVGIGLATGLVAFTALERTVRLDVWVMVGIAVASALAGSGVTYLALKPSTEVNEAKETKNVGACCEAADTVC